MTEDAEWEQLERDAAQSLAKGYDALADKEIDVMIKAAEALANQYRCIEVRPDGCDSCVVKFESLADTKPPLHPFEVTLRHDKATCFDVGGVYRFEAKVELRNVERVEEAKS